MQEFSRKFCGNSCEVSSSGNSCTKSSGNSQKLFREFLQNFFLGCHRQYWPNQAFLQLFFFRNFVHRVFQNIPTLFWWISPEIFYKFASYFFLGLPPRIPREVSPGIASRCSYEIPLVIPSIISSDIPSEIHSILPPKICTRVLLKICSEHFSGILSKIPAEIASENLLRSYFCLRNHFQNFRDFFKSFNKEFFETSSIKFFRYSSENFYTNFTWISSEILPRV